MRTMICLACGLGLLFGLAGCSGSKDKDENQPPDQAQTTPRPADLKVDAALVAPLNGLGFRLYGELAKTDASTNLFISPASIEMALAMAYNGAEGDTRAAMATALGYGELTLEQVNAGNAQLLTLLKNPDAKVQLAIANSLWGREGIEFEADFLQRNRDFYQANVTTLDFTQPAAADTINQWVSDHTAGKIPTLVTPEMLQATLLALINALYFKGEWTTPFDPAQTQDGPFTLLDGTTKTLPMMHRSGEMRYMETGQFQAVSLPYGDQYVTMDIFLPKPEMSFATFRAMLTAENYTRWAGQFQSREGTLALPRFKANYSAGLAPPLSALGMGIAFTDRADFSGMLADDTIKALISTVVHKTVIEVNEEGTEAAAATGVVVGVTSVPPAPFTMTVNRPFFFTIRDNPTGVVLFMGTIVNPE